MANTNTRMKPKIIGVDFDNTLFEHSWPRDDSSPVWPVIDYVKAQKEAGAKIILVTCRESEDDLKWAIEAAERVGLIFDAVNDNLPDDENHWDNTRKIWCDEYIDDKNLSLGDVHLRIKQQRFQEVRNHLSEAALFEQWAEEAAELAKECLKTARILRGENPTPVTLDEALANVREEYTDVEQCAMTIGVSVDYPQMLMKNIRWKARILEKERGGK